MSSNTNPVLTLTDLGLTISVWFDRYDTVEPARSQYGYHIADRFDHRVMLAEGTDLRCPGDPDLPEAMRALLSFWSAAVESYDYKGMEGENAHLFPETLLSLGLSSDEVSYTASWLGGES